MRNTNKKADKRRVRQTNQTEKGRKTHRQAQSLNNIDIKSRQIHR